ncbi:MAG: 5-deoxy-glucuronate isomerase [Clostridiales Family XIII bacterium]|jgi:5-deoxy-glucuronate isomerase|nr:5-deoxy-glucuronate isomerase [Clostridiales Family XIII bacterium]
MAEYLIKAKDNPEVACSLTWLDFQVRDLAPGETFAGEAEGKETGITVLYGRCDITAGGETFAGAGARDRIEPGSSPHVALIPPGARYEVKARTDVKISVSETPAGGRLAAVAHIPAGSIPGARRGTGRTERTIYDLIPEGIDTKLMIYEVYTPEGNWSSFPPHKHDTDSDDESLLEEVYLFHFDPPEGFALIWLCDDEGQLDHAYAARDGDLELIPRGYHSMCVSPGYLCSTHAVMAGPTNEWKIHFKEEFKHLYDWDK